MSDPDIDHKIADVLLENKILLRTIVSKPVMLCDSNCENVLQPFPQHTTQYGLIHQQSGYASFKNDSVHLLLIISKSLQIVGQRYSNCFFRYQRLPWMTVVTPSRRPSTPLGVLKAHVNVIKEA